DKVYPKRFSHVEQLRRMGASVELKGASAFIQGGERLRGEWVHASDIRAGFCLLIAGFMARGVTRLTGVEHLERGCDNVIGAFRSLGADLRLSEDLEPSRQSAQNQSL